MPWTVIHATIVLVATLLIISLLIATFVFVVNRASSMHKSDALDYALATMVLGIVVTAIVAPIYWATVTSSHNSCLHKWGDNGKWSISGGCAVRLSDGTYVSESSVKVLVTGEGKELIVKI